MCQALHRSLGPQRFGRLYVVCDQMGQADIGVHQPRDENIVRVVCGYKNNKISCVTDPVLLVAPLYIIL